MEDAELRHLLQSSAAETRQRLDALAARMEVRFGEIENRFAQIDDRFAQIDSRFGEIDDRFVQLESGLTKRIDDSAAETRAYARELAVDSRHQFEIVVEDLRHRLEFVAEHVMENSASIQQLDAKVDGIFAQHDLRITRLEASSPH